MSNSNAGAFSPRLGDPLSSLDTPAMLVDVAAMEQNIAQLMTQLRAHGVRVRPHLKTVKSPELARLLMAAGAQGGCVAKLSEAEVLAGAGIEDLLITTELYGETKLRRLVALLERHPQIKLVVDSAAGASAVHQALSAAARPVDVLIDLDVGQHRCGVPPGAPALALAQHVATLSQLRLIGVQGYEGHLQQVPDRSERERRCHEAMRELTDTAERLKAAGYRIEVVTTGGTGTAEFCASYPGVTEVQPGSFVFMDSAYGTALGPVYANALTILSTVISRPRPHEAVVDAGLKSLSTDSGPAQPKSLPGMQYRPAGDEHGIVSWDATSRVELALGDRIELIPSHIDTTINLHDHYYAQRGGQLVAIWPVATRGHVQ
jgi:D-serine deaminase-like pyridoxal phosphate-dependent protein